MAYVEAGANLSGWSLLGVRVPGVQERASLSDSAEPREELPLEQPGFLGAFLVTVADLKIMEKQQKSSLW